MGKICNATFCNYSQFGGNYCKNHQYLRTDGKQPKPIERKPIKRKRKVLQHKKAEKVYSYRRTNAIKPISEKHVARLRDYKVVRNTYLFENSICECGCKRQATEVHHKLHVRTGKALTDTKYFMAVCRKCHVNIHEYPKNSVEKGWLISAEEKNRYLKTNKL